MRTWSWALLCAGSMLIAGCEDPLVGEWEYDGSGWDLELTIDSDETGVMKADDNGRESRWDVKWSEKGDDYELDLECHSGECTGSSDCTDCTLDCALDDDKLEVTDGPGDWDGVKFRRVD